MIDLGERDACLGFLDYVLEQSGADETQAVVFGGRRRTVSFADDGVSTTCAISRVALRVRAVRMRGTTAFVGDASTDDLSDEGVRDVIARARAATHTARPRPGWYALTVPELYAANAQSPRGHYDSSTAAAGPALLADRVSHAVLAARRRHHHGVRGHCTVTVGEPDPTGVVAVANTQGLRRHHFGTAVDARVRVETRPGVAAQGMCFGRRIDAIDLASAFEDAEVRAESSSIALAHDAVDGFPVLLEPAVVRELVRALLPAFSRRAIDAGRSLLHGNPGQLVGASSVSMIADPADPVILGRPFDDEGVPTRALELIRDGRTVDMCVPRDPTSYSRDASGYGAEPDVWADAVPRHVVLRAGDGSVAELRARHPGCAVVGRLSQTQLVDGRQTIISGIARDGVLAAESGSIVGSTGEAGVVARAYDVLLNVIDASAPVPFADMAVPALLVAADAVSIHRAGSP